MFVCDRYQLLFDSASIDPALQRGARGFTVFRRDVACNHAERGRQYRGVVGEAEDRQHVRDEIERQDEISDGAKQRRLHVAWGLFVEGAIIRRKQIFGKGSLPPPA